MRASRELRDSVLVDRRLPFFIPKMTFGFSSSSTLRKPRHCALLNCRGFLSVSEPHLRPHHEGYFRKRIHRYTGLTPVKAQTPKSDWQVAREREFLHQRAKIPGGSGFIGNLTDDDLRNCSNDMRDMLGLECASRVWLNVQTNWVFFPVTTQMTIRFSSAFSFSKEAFD